MVAYALSQMSVGSVAYVADGKKKLVKDVHRLDQLHIRLKDSPKGVSWFIITPNHL